MNSTQPEPARDVQKPAHDLLVWGGSSVPSPATGSTSSTVDLHSYPRQDADETLDQGWGDDEPILRRSVEGGWA